MYHQRFRKFLLGGISGLLFFSCVDSDYDLKKDINMDVTVGLNGLTFPVGNTEKINLTELIDTTDNVLSLIDGQFAVQKEGTIDKTNIQIDGVTLKVVPPAITPITVDFDYTKVKDMKIDSYDKFVETNIPTVKIEDIQIDKIYLKSTLKGASVPAVAQPLNTSFEYNTGTFNCDFSFDLPDEISQVKKVYFGSEKGQLVHFDIDLSDIQKMMSSNGFSHKLSNFELTFPDIYNLSKDNNSVLADKMTVRDNVIQITDAPLDPSVQKLSISFYILSVTLNTKARAYNFDGEIKYKIKYDISGTTSGTAISPQIPLLFDQQLTFYDGDVVTNSIDFDLNQTKFDFNATIKDLKDVQSLRWVTFSDAKLVLKVSDPQIPLSINPKGYFYIQLPDFIQASIASAPFGTTLESNRLKVRADQAFGAVITLNILKANLSGFPIVDGELNLTTDVTTFAEDLSFLPKEVKVSSLLGIENKQIHVELIGGVLKVADADLTTNTIKTSFETKTTLTANQSVPKELKSIMTVSPIVGTNPQLKLNLKLPANFPSGINSVSFSDFQVTFPDFIIFGNKEVVNGVLTLNDSFNPRTGYTKILTIDHFDFSKFNNKQGLKAVLSGADNRIHLNQDLTQQLDVQLNGEIKIGNSQISLNSLKNIVISPSISMDDVKVGIVEGTFEPEIDPINETIDLELGDDLSFLKEDATLDLTNPQINIQMTNTTGVPVEAKLYLSALDDNGQIIANSQIDPISLTLKAAETDGVPTASNFLISKQGTLLSGSDPVTVPNLSNLLKVIPDKISIRIEAQSQKDVLHRVDLTPASKKEIEGNYSVVVPFEFDAIKLNYTETIEDLQDDLDDVSDDQGRIELILTTNIENTIPLEMQLTAKGFDTNRKEIPGITCNQCTIPAGGLSTPSTTPVSIQIIAEKGTLKQLDQLDLIISGNCDETVGGVSLRQDQYIQLNEMKLRVNGGFSMNLDK